MRTQAEVTLPLRLERENGTDLPSQIVAQLREMIADGILAPGDAVPSSRALAGHLAVSRGTIVTAYDQLIAEGWFEAAPGRSTVVNPRLHDVHPARPAVPTREPVPASRPTIDLRPGRPMQDGVISPAWKAAWRRAADAPVDVSMPALGWLPLRHAIADHLRRMRAVIADPERILVTAGGREGLAALLMASGARTVGVENPGFPSLRNVLTQFGLTVVPLPTDAQGLVTSALPDDAPDLVIVTPSHQYPLGGSLPVDRRQALLAWAARRGVIVVEDDYDSELRYTSAPLPALTSLDSAGSVALLGTFAKTLTPSLALGYLVVPESQLDAVRAVRATLGHPVNLVTQRAVADYLDSGALGRHTQRMRNLYRRRRAQVVAAFKGLDGVSVYPMDGGLHAVVEHGRDEQAVLKALASKGVEVAALSSYWSADGPRRGLVFGFGGVSDADLARGLSTIRETLARSVVAPG